MSPEKPPAPPLSARALWVLVVAAALSSLVVLPLNYVGEEAILVNSSLEMWHRGDWLRLWLYGIDLQHGVFANWLIILVSSAVGWEHALAVTRGWMILATAASGGLIAFLVHRLWRDPVFAAFAAATYLTFLDVLLYRGWLGYRDPLFGCLTFAAITFLWLGARERRIVWLAASVAAISCAFLTKGIIAYVFLGSAVLVLLFRSEYRSFLLRPLPITVGLAAAALLAGWLFGMQNGEGQGSRMTSEILAKLRPDSVREYLVKLVAYPLEIMVRLAPVSLAAAWLLARRPTLRAEWLGDPDTRMALGIAIICMLPYWLAPHSHIRYLAPLLPLFAVAAAAVIWLAGGRSVTLTLRAMWAAVAIKIILLTIAFPYYQQVYRGENYEATAREIVNLTEGQLLYSNNVSASGLSVAAHVNLMRLPAAPIQYPPAAWTDGFVMVYGERDVPGSIVRRYRLGGAELFLLCRGTACQR